MIAKILTNRLSDVERSQLSRKDLARGAWAEGRTGDARLILETVLEESMTPRVAAECYVTEAAFLAEESNYEGSLRYLDLAAPFIDSADIRVQRGFYHQRAKVRRELGDLDSALNDYTGAAIYAQQLGDTENEGAALLNTANIHLDLGELESARANLEKALKIFRETNSFYLAQAYDSLASLSLAEGSIGTAIEAINIAFDLVGDNESWRVAFAETRTKIEAKVLELLKIERVEDLDRLKVALVREALIKAGGNLSHAGKLIGLTYKGVDYIVQQDSELKRFRPPRKPRRKSLIKKSR